MATRSRKRLGPTPALRLRNAQRVTLREASRSGFEARVLDHLRRVLPADLERLGEQRVRTLIEEGVARAASYGITSKRDVTLFVDLMVGVDPEFERLPSMAWAEAILSDSTLAGSAKMALLYEQLPRRLKLVPPSAKGD
jgi:hypothetical protein